MNQTGSGRHYVKIEGDSRTRRPSSMVPYCLMAPIHARSRLDKARRNAHAHMIRVGCGSRVIANTHTGNIDILFRNFIVIFFYGNLGLHEGEGIKHNAFCDIMVTHYIFSNGIADWWMTLSLKLAYYRRVMLKFYFKKFNAKIHIKYFTLPEKLRVKWTCVYFIVVYFIVVPKTFFKIINIRNCSFKYDINVEIHRKKELLLSFENVWLATWQILKWDYSVLISYYSTKNIYTYYWGIIFFK